MTHDPLYASIAETASTDDPSLHRVLIVGGGAAGLRLTSLLGATLGRKRKASITLLDRSRIHVWKPLLHEVASGSMDSETDSVELIAHARRRHYRYRIGEMVGLNRAKRQIYVAPSVDEDGRTVIPPRVLGYDTLVIAVGSLSNDFGTPGVAEHAVHMAQQCFGALHAVIHAAGIAGSEAQRPLLETDLAESTAIWTAKRAGTQQLAAVRRLAPDAQALRKILYSNAARVLKIT